MASRMNIEYAPQRAYRAICFDLDGTLLPMDIDEFMGAYFQRIVRFMVARGLDGDRFMEALKGGIRSMATHTDDAPNDQAFWDTFFEVYGPLPITREQARALADEFYDQDFCHIGDGFAGDPNVPLALATLKEKGYPLLLTTMPMFPRRAVEHRLAWAGLDPALFDRITTYSNSKSVKPHQTYYAENLAAMGLSGEEVLMVGNNTMEDLSFLDLGADAYLVTDCLLDPVDFDLSTVRHGTFGDFTEWVTGLPVCEDPATDITDDAIDRLDMERALAANAIASMDLEAARDNAAAVADAVAADYEPGAASRMKSMKGRK